MNSVTVYKDYILEGQIVDMRRGGRLSQSIILKYDDRSEWVYLNNNVEERFCGFLFLQNALRELNINNILPAENRMAIHEREIIYLSKYCGEKKLDSPENDDKLEILRKVGFIDFAGYANLRIEDGKIWVFDTEKSSFDKEIRDTIDVFVDLHKTIRASLEEKLKN